MDFIVAPTRAKVARHEAHIEELSVAHLVDDAALDLAYEGLEEMDQAISKLKQAPFCSINQMTEVYYKQQEEIANINKYVHLPSPFHFVPPLMLAWHRFIASAGTYANLVRQAKSKLKRLWV